MPSVPSVAEVSVGTNGNGRVKWIPDGHQNMSESGYRRRKQKLEDFKERKQQSDGDEDIEPSDMGEFTVSDELYSISEATNSDGTVDVTIYDFEKLNNGNVRVHFYTPTMEQESEVMEWPKKDSIEYKFVRLCRKTVGSLSGAKWLKTDGADIKADPDKWEIDASMSGIETAKHNIKNLTIGKLLSAAGITLVIGWFLGLGALFIGIPIYALLSVSGVVASIGALTPIWIVATLAFLISIEIASEG